MSQEPDFPVHDARIQAAVAKRAARLVEALKSTVPPVSQTIVAAIETRGEDTEFDALARLLRDEDGTLREEAARWIELHAGQSDPPATPGWETGLLCQESENLLLAGLSDPDPHVRRHLLRAYPVLKFGDPADALPLLLESLTAEQAGLRIAALRAVQAVGRDLASGAVDQIADLANDVSEVRGEVYAVLAWLGADAASAVPALVSRVAEEDDQDRKRQAAHALLCVDPQAVELARVEEPSLRESLLEALSELGEPARQLRQRLPQAWKESADARYNYVWLNMEDVSHYLERDASTIKRWLNDRKLRHHGEEGSGRGKVYAWDPDELARLREFSRKEKRPD